MSSRKPTQMDRVLEASRSYRGVCQAELLGPDVVDGGKPITRLAARIEDLETKRQCVFENLGWKSGTKIYRLVSAPDSQRSIDTGDSSPSAGLTPSRPVDGSLSAEQRLFEPPPMSHYQEAA